MMRPAIELQDNGEAYTATGSSWTMTEGGDGGFSATDWTNGEIAYEEYVFGGISRSSTGGAGSWAVRPPSVISRSDPSREFDRRVRPLRR